MALHRVGLESSSTGLPSHGCYCLSNAMYSSIGQNIKPLACPMSVVWCLVSNVRCPMSSMRTFNSYPGMNRKWAFWHLWMRFWCDLWTDLHQIRNTAFPYHVLVKIFGSVIGSKEVLISEQVRPLWIYHFLQTFLTCFARWQHLVCHVIFLILLCDTVLFYIFARIHNKKKQDQIIFFADWNHMHFIQGYH